MTKVKITSKNPESGKEETLYEGTDKQFSDSVEKFGKIADEHGIPRTISDTLAGKGHNRVGGIAADDLRTIIARIEKPTDEKQAIQGDISDVYGEAKGRGFDVRALREIVKIRKLDASEREERETILDTYMHALGMDI